MNAKRANARLPRWRFDAAAESIAESLASTNQETNLTAETT
jgi:hypothetical protein